MALCIAHVCLQLTEILLCGTHINFRTPMLRIRQKRSLVTFNL